VAKDGTRPYNHLLVSNKVDIEATKQHFK
jgi:hypothetical protein